MRYSGRRYGVFKRFLQNELANGSEDEAEQPPLFLPSRTDVIDSVQFYPPAGAGSRRWNSAAWSFTKSRMFVGGSPVSWYMASVTRS